MAADYVINVNVRFEHSREQWAFMLPKILYDHG